jgi:hypothetical protein
VRFLCTGTAAKISKYGMAADLQDATYVYIRSNVLTPEKYLYFPEKML